MVGPAPAPKCPTDAARGLNRSAKVPRERRKDQKAEVRVIRGANVAGTPAFDLEPTLRSSRS